VTIWVYIVLMANAFVNQLIIGQLLCQLVVINLILVESSYSNNKLNDNKMQEALLDNHVQFIRVISICS
jgi:hypothetical protein